MAIFSALAIFFPATFGPAASWLLGTRITQGFIALAKSVAWSLGAAALNRPRVPRQEVMANITQADGPRIKAYGRVLLGGQRAFWEADKSEGMLYQIILAHHGRVDGLERFWVDGEPVTVNASGAVTSAPFEGVSRPDLRLEFRAGVGEGGGYSRIRTAFPTLWTASHRLDGQATIAAYLDHPGLERFSKVFPKGPQTLIQGEMRGSLVRNGAGVMAYSENAAWCIRDYMTHQDGWRIPAAAIDAASFASFAALCDEPVALKSGATEPRYRVSGYFTLDDPPKEVTGRLLAACDGQIYQTPEGKVGILGGRWSIPDVTITADDILAFDARDGFDPFTDFNVLKVSFISPEHGYQPTEVQDRRDMVALATQPERVEQVDYDMVPSGAQAQRLQKIEFAKRRRKLEGTLTTNLVGLKARFPKGDGIHTIRVIAPEFEVDDVFEVTSHSFDIGSGTCEIGIASLTSPYGWNAATEERPLPIDMAGITRPNATITPPTGASLTQVPVRVSGDTWGGKLRLTVNAVNRRDLTLEAQVAEGDWPANDPIFGGGDERPTWTTMGGDRFSAETSILENEETYTVRYRWRGQSTWQKAGTVTIIANPTIPSAPTAFARVGSVGAEMRWTNPETNFFKARLFRNTSNSFAGASFVSDVNGLAGQQSSYTDTPGAGAWFYFVVSLNGSSVASPPAGPVQITI